MWIIPKTLSAFVPATPGWSLESSERAWMFAQSVTWRSKFMSKQYWLKRFKKGDYVQHLSGLTLSPSMHDHFVESWTESQEASHVSHFQAPENEKDKKTQGTYGQASQTLFDFADPDGSSSKTCQDWLPLGCVTSCKTWGEWVTERRGVYSQRKKLARHTKGNESSSWGTPQASDHIEGARTAKESNQKCLGRDLNQMENWPTPRAGNPGSRKPGTGGKILAEEAKKNWGTPRGSMANSPTQKQIKLGAPAKKIEDQVMCEKHNGPPAPEKSNTSGKNHGSWATPIVGDAHLASTPEVAKKRLEEGKKTLSRQTTGKLNPGFVEQLMGLEVGWTQLPTEWIDSDS